MRTIRVHRQGYAGSDHPDGNSTLLLQAEDGLALLRGLGITRAHLVGHSYGGLLALRMALLEPGAVATLSLLEPPMLADPEAQQFVREQLGPVVGLYQKEGPERGPEAFLDAVGGPGSRAKVEQAMPGAFAIAVRDAKTLFEREFSDIEEGLFHEGEAPKIRIPSLSVVGDQSAPLFTMSHSRLLKWLPNVEALDVSNATHFLQVQEPRAVAEGVARFLAKHPIG